MNPNIINNFFGIKVSKPGINVANASDSQLMYKNDYNTELFYDDSGVPVVLIGLNPNTGTRGLYVSPQGVDVTKASDEQLIFNTGQYLFKVVGHFTSQTATFSLAIPAAALIAMSTVSNNFNYDSPYDFTPSLAGQVVNSDGSLTILPTVIANNPSANIYVQTSFNLISSATKTQLQVTALGFNATGSGTFNYTVPAYNVDIYILQQSVVPAIST